MSERPPSRAPGWPPSVVPEDGRLRSVDEVFHPRTLWRQAYLFAALFALALFAGFTFVIVWPKAYTSEVRILIDSTHDSQSMLRLERESIGLAGELDLIAEQRDRLLVRRERLFAQQAGRADFALPAALAARADDPALARLLADQRELLQSEFSRLSTQRNRLNELIEANTAEVAALERQIAAKQEQASIVGEERERLQALLDRALTTATRILEVERQAADVASQISNLERQITRARSDMARARLDLEALDIEFEGRTVAELGEVKQDIDRLQTRSRTMDLQLARQTSGLSGEPLNPLFIQNQVELLDSDRVVDRAFNVYLARRTGEVAATGTTADTTTDTTIDRGMARLRQLAAFRENLATGRVQNSSVLFAHFTAADSDVAVAVVAELTAAFTEAFRTVRVGPLGVDPGLNPGLDPGAGEGGRASIRVLKGPTVPSAPDGPGGTSILLASVVFAAMLATVGAFARELFETRLRTRRDINRALGVECLGIIARGSALEGTAGSQDGLPVRSTKMPGRGGATGANLPTFDVARPSAAATLTVRRLLSGIVAAKTDGSAVTVGITSAGAGEGKTSLATTLARMALADGWQVLLVDAGVRPQGARDRPGFAELFDGGAALAGDTDPSTASVTGNVTGSGTGSVTGSATGALTVDVTGDFLTGDFLTGDFMGIDTVSVPRDGAGEPMGHIYAKGFSRFMAAVRARYDVVIFDLTSLTLHSDVRAVSGWLDGLVLVVEWQAVPADTLRYGVSMAGGTTGLPVWSALFNQVDMAAYRRLDER